MWWSRLDPPPRQGRDRFDHWQFGDGAASRQIGAEVIETVLTAAQSTFQTLLHRESLLEILEDLDGHTIFGGALRHLNAQTLRAVILSDYGETQELIAALQHLGEDARQIEIAGSDTWASTCRAVIDWATARIVAVESTAGT